MFVEWIESYSVGIPEIDAEHKRLVALINELHSAYVAGQSRQDVVHILNGLVAYIATHFVHEEAFLRETHYPQIDAHIQLHQKFAKEVASKCRRVRGDQFPRALELLSFLKTWLINHIIIKDKEYGAFIEEKIFDTMPNYSRG